MLQTPDLIHNTDLWKIEFRNSLKTNHEIQDFFGLSCENIHYPSFIPKNFAHKIKAHGLGSPLAKQFLPNILENSTVGLYDPIGDKVHAKNNGIIHRYENRILFTPTAICPITCRYCFRKNELAQKEDIFKHSLAELEKYLKNHKQVNEVILSGGDPLILSNEKIKEILKLLHEQNIKFVRFHTRTPIILPSRIDNGFIETLKTFEDKFTKILFFLHTNHADEIDEEVEIALKKLTQTKVEKRTQTVLLKGVNDQTETLIQLFYRVIECGFTPYYLHHPDEVMGGMHFYLSLAKGREIYLNLRQKLPGWAIPHYVKDHPSGKKLVLGLTDSERQE